MWTYTWFIHHSLLSLAVCIDALSQVSQLSQWLLLGEDQVHMCGQPPVPGVPTVPNILPHAACRNRHSIPNAGAQAIATTRVSI
jgi:hypothetical protein